MITFTQNRPSQLAVWMRLSHYFQNPWTYVLVLVTLVLGLMPMVQGSIARAADPQPAQAELVAEAQPTGALPANEVFLYGQSPEPDQIGAGYMVFETLENRVVGALYMPYSSFDCFEGRLDSGQLAMTITNSYTQETYPYAVALQPAEAIASASGGAAPLQLEGFHQLASPSDNDLNILSVCKANLEAAEL